VSTGDSVDEAGRSQLRGKIKGAGGREEGNEENGKKTARVQDRIGLSQLLSSYFISLPYVRAAPIPGPALLSLQHKRQGLFLVASQLLAYVARG
jgi:hypothetical protein